MAETLTFAHTYNYDTTRVGITVEAKLLWDGKCVECQPKIDTGASDCIFRRVYGEILGLDIESGYPQSFGTAVGSFRAFGHEITISVLGIETVATVYFAEYEGFRRDVLGQNGWLNRVRLGLVDYEGQLYLSHNEDEF